MQEENGIDQTMLIFLFQNILEANITVLGPNYIFSVAIQIQYNGRSYKE